MTMNLSSLLLLSSFLGIFLDASSAFRSVNFRKNYIFRAKTVALNDIPDPNIVAELRPLQAIACTSILSGFALLQSKVVRANKLFEDISINEKQLKEAKNMQLVGEEGSGGSVVELERRAKELEKQRDDAMTILSIPSLGVVLRIRLPQSPGTATATVVASSSSEDTQQAVESFDSPTGRSTELTDKPIFKRSVRAQLTGQQILQLIVGAIIVAAQVGLLTLFWIDPVTSSSSSYSTPSQEQVKQLSPSESKFD
jgi:hypothetical protein